VEQWKSLEKADACVPNGCEVGSANEGETGATHMANQIQTCMPPKARKEIGGSLPQHISGAPGSVNAW